MLLQIKRWFAPPVFPNDEAKTRRAMVLNTTLLTTLALALLLIAGNLAGGNVPPAVSGVNFVVCAVCLVLRHWASQGRIGLAGGGLLAVGLVGVTLAIALLGTIRVPAAGVYMLLVITAGLLFDRGGLIIMTGLCALAMAGLIVAENAEWLPRPDYAVTLTQWITYTVLFAWAGSLTLASLRSLRQALTRANQEIAERQQAESQREAALAVLQQADAGLEQRVAERTDELWQVSEVLWAEVTRRQQAEERVVYLATFPERATVLILETDLHGAILYTNPSLKRTLEAMGESDPCIFIPQDIRGRLDGTAAMEYPPEIREIDIHGKTFEENVHFLSEFSSLRIYASDITARKQAEQARETQNVLLSALINSPADIIIFALDRNYCYMAFNDRHRAEMKKVWEADIEPGMNLLEMMHMPELRAVAQASIDRALRGEAFSEIQHQPDPDIYYEFSWNPICQAADVIGVTAFIRDITDRKHAEEVLRETNAYLENLINYANAPIIVWDPHFRITRFNHAFEFLTGRTEAEVIGQSLEILFPPALAENSMALIRQTLSGEHWETVEIEIRHRDESVRTVLWNSATLFASDGQTPIATIAQGQDITERKRLEQALEFRARELGALNRASHAITSTLDLDVLLDLIIGEIKNLVDAQSASVLLYEPATDELIFSAGVGPHFAQLLHTRMPVSAGIAGWAAREKRSALVGDAQIDPRFYTQIDQLIGNLTRDLLAVPLLAKGRFSGVIEAVNKSHGTFDEHDLEILEGLAAAAVIAIENARLYQQEREQFKRLQQTQAQMIHFEKMAALGRLIASIAHEINNPLQSVQGCIGLALEELAGRRRYDKLTSYLDMTAGEIERIMIILNRMRDFYRPSAPEMRPLDAHSVLRDVLELADKHLQRSGIVVAREWPADLPPIVANADHLKQVFLNLVLNAIDAMPTGGVLRVQTRPDQLAAPDGQRLPAVRIDFTDTGGGIPPEVLPHVFEPFFTAKKGGAGLGLSISYGIIEAHNGQITATSQVGQGATFTIVLPIEQP